MIRRLLFVSVLTGLPITAFAGGLTGADAPTRIPVPAAVHGATVYDRSGTAVEVTRVTYNGEVFVYGTVGEGTVSIPFDKIAEVRVEPSTVGTKRIAFVKLKDGQSVKVSVDFDVPCYGETTYGYYKIEVDKIGRIVFHGRKDAE